MYSAYVVLIYSCLEWYVVFGEPGTYQSLVDFTVEAVPQYSYPVSLLDSLYTLQKV
jgi:hypothetical protein